MKRFNVSCERRGPLPRQIPEGEEAHGPLARPIWARVGRVVKARGLKGEVKVIPDASSAAETTRADRYYVEEGGGRLFSARVLRVWRQKNALVVALEGVRNRDQAERLVGSALYLPRRELPALPEGAYYHTDLIGAWVWDERHRFLGVLDNILETGANDVWVVVDGTEELLLPAIKEVVREINVEEGYVVARPLDWI